uniref:Uncharacterized protein n=1 Tax=Anguilla anguilla TaxID=7936 RepID=A0A0E9X4M1_ANGAN
MQFIYHLQGHINTEICSYSPAFNHLLQLFKIGCGRHSGVGICCCLLRNLNLTPGPCASWCLQGLMFLPYSSSSIFIPSFLEFVFLEVYEV